MSLTLHAAEDLLAAIHARDLDATSAIVDQALACLDQVSNWVDDFEAHGSLPAHAGDDARVMAGRLRDLRSGSAPEGLAATDGKAPAAAAGAALPEWVSRLVDSAQIRISGRAGERPAQLLAISYEPHANCFFDGDDPLNLMRQIPDLLAFRIEARKAWPPLADLDPFACNLRLEAISGGNRAELADIFRLVPDQVRIIDIPPEALRLVPALWRRMPLACSAPSSKSNVGSCGFPARAKSLPAALAPRRAPPPTRCAKVERSHLAEQIDLAKDSGARTPRRRAAAFGPRRNACRAGDPICRPAMASPPRLREQAGSQTDQAQRPASRSLRVDEFEDRCAVQSGGRADRG